MSEGTEAYLLDDRLAIARSMQHALELVSTHYYERRDGVWQREARPGDPVKARPTRGLRVSIGRVQADGHIRIDVQDAQGWRSGRPLIGDVREYDVRLSPPTPVTGPSVQDGEADHA